MSLSKILFFLRLAAVFTAWTISVDAVQSSTNSVSLTVSFAPTDAQSLVIGYATSGVGGQVTLYSAPSLDELEAHPEPMESAEVPPSGQGEFRMAAGLFDSARFYKVLLKPITAGWSSLWALAPSTQPLLIRKVDRGIPTEGYAVGPGPHAILYQPLEASGRYWARHWFSPAGAGATTSGARILRSTWSELYSSALTDPPDVGVGQRANFVTGTQAYAAGTTLAANAGSGRTESGAGWATYSGGGQTPFTRFSATAADSVTYRITGVNRIQWRAFANSANGGTISVAITESGTPITAAQYLVGPQGGARVVKLNYHSSAFSGSQFSHIPLAKGLDPTKTYVVTLALLSGTRIYDSGLLGYSGAADGYAFNSEGLHGLWDNYTAFYATSGNRYAASLYPGSRVVYLTGACTRIDWSHVQRVNGGFAGVKIYTQAGLEIASSYYRNLTTHANGDRYLNTYANSSLERVTTIAEGLPEAAYYVHIYSLPDAANGFTESATGGYLSTKWTIYSGQVRTYNTAQAGVVGTDAFTDSQQQFIGGGSDPADGAGSLVFAAQVRDSGDADFNSLPEEGYVTATHGAETYPSGLVITVDGVAIDWAKAAVGHQWIGDSIVISFTTQIGTQANPTSYWADAHYRYTFTPSGVDHDFKLVTTRAIHRGVWFVNMGIAPNASATNGTLLGSGFGTAYVEPDITQAVTTHPGRFAYPYTVEARGFAFYSPEGHAVAMRHLNPLEFWADSPAGDTRTVLVRRLRVTKGYGQLWADPTSGGAGFALPSGYTLRARGTTRCFFDATIPTLLSP